MLNGVRHTGCHSPCAGQDDDCNEAHVMIFFLSMELWGYFWSFLYTVEYGAWGSCSLYLCFVLGHDRLVGSLQVWI